MLPKVQGKSVDTDQQNFNKSGVPGKPKSVDMKDDTKDSGIDTDNHNFNKSGVPGKPKNVKMPTVAQYTDKLFG